MANQFYVEQSDRSYRSGVANETIVAGELVHDDGDGVDVLVFADLDNDDEGHVGLALYDYLTMVAEDDDAIASEQYASGDRVKYAPFESDARVRIRTPEDNGTDGGPSISHMDVVGVLDDQSTVSSAAEFQGRVVQEGYTDDAATTYNRANNNFQAIGVAYRPAKQNGNAVTAFDEPIRVELFSEFEDTA